MARKKDTPQKAALREIMGNYIKENNVKVKDGTDVNSIISCGIWCPSSWKVFWLRKWMKKWDIPSMIIGTRKRIIPEMAIPRRPCIPVTAIWRLIFQETGKVSLSHRSSKSIRIRSLRTWKKGSSPCMPKEWLRRYRKPYAGTLWHRDFWQYHQQDYG